MQISELLTYIESRVPLIQQEEYDNSGIQCGDASSQLQGVLVCIDVTESVIDEAIRKGCNLIVAHHPLLFRPVKKILYDNYINRCLIKALKNNLVVYAAHTNLDNDDEGVNFFWANKMGLKNARVIQPLKHHYFKLSTYIPVTDAERLREAFLDSSLGKLGDYDGTSFSVMGKGRLRALEGAHPYIGEVGEWHSLDEEKVEILVPKDLVSKALGVIKETHPYEEPAIDFVQVGYQNPSLGGGVIGELDSAISLGELIDKMKEFQPIQHVQHSKVLKKSIKRVAFCGGSGSFMYKDAAKLGADIFITGEAKYNDFYDAQDFITLMTIGHFESELLTKDLLISIMSEKRSNFAIHNSTACDNPVHYI